MSNHHGTLEKQREFYANNRAYYAEYNRAYRLANKEYFRHHKDIERMRRRALINSLKDKPCADCGVRYQSCVMQFDHREPKLKVYNVSQMETKTEEKILTEAAKCDVVCANCHMMRTHVTRPARRKV